MLVFSNPEFRRPRGRPGRKAPPRPFALVSASFDAGGPWVRLRFNRPINVDGLVGNQILVNDGPSGTQFDGILGATLLDPATVQIDMSEVQALPFPDTRLNASPTNGIVATEDGQAWSGVANLLLPFPS